MELKPEDKIRIHQARKAILRKLYKILKVNPRLKEDKALPLMEAETSTLFDQLFSVFEGIVTHEPNTVKAKAHVRKRIQQNTRTEHVGRFFIHVMEQKLHDAELHSCVVPALARSVSLMIGVEAYNQFQEKINRLIEFAETHGFDYDQMLASKPGQEIMKSIFTLYRSEMKKSPAVEDKLRNRLDEALVQYSIRYEGKENVNIEEEVEKGLEAFVSLIQKGITAGVKN